MMMMMMIDHLGLTANPRKPELQARAEKRSSKDVV